MKIIRAFGHDFTNINLSLVLRNLYACDEAREWATTQPDALTAWHACQRGDWLLWIAVYLADRKLVVRAACAVARTVLHVVPDGEERPRIAIETAEGWTRGDATIKKVRTAAAAAANAAYAANNAAANAAYAAADAACAAYAAADAAYAAYAAADAAYANAAAANAAYAAYAAAADRQTSLARSADIVRSIISFEDLRLP